MNFLRDNSMNLNLSPNVANLIHASTQQKQKKNVEIKNFKNRKKNFKKNEISPDKAPYWDEVAGNETREMHPKHVRAYPKFARGEKNFEFFFKKNVFTWNYSQYHH